MQDLQLATAALGGNIPVSVETLTKSYAILANKGRAFDANHTSVISPKTVNSVNQMLIEVVKNGTGTLAAIPGVTVAGKTGTITDNAAYAKDPRLALFAGYAPANAPRYAMLVVIEDGHLNKNGEVLTAGGKLPRQYFKRLRYGV